MDRGFFFVTCIVNFIDQTITMLQSSLKFYWPLIFSCIENASLVDSFLLPVKLCAADKALFAVLLQCFKSFIDWTLLVTLLQFGRSFGLYLLFQTFDWWKYYKSVFTFKLQVPSGLPVTYNIYMFLNIIIKNITLFQKVHWPFLLAGYCFRCISQLLWCCKLSW